MTPDEARLLFEYNTWARHRLLAAVDPLTQEQFLRPMGNSFGSVRDTLTHLYGAERIWLERWTGGAPTALPAASAFPDLPSLRAAWAELEPQIAAFAAGLDAALLERTRTYRAFNGQEATLPYWQMIQHVVNHGSYHRGQVTTLLRQLGAAPPAGMDLVAFYRERNR